MSPERWQQIKGLLDGMEEQPISGRYAWLEQACGEDRRLLAEVEGFLSRETRLDGFLEDDAASGLGVTAGDPAGESGNRIGPYRVLGMLGRGGMGAVYEAVREDDFEQRVALKLVLEGPNHGRILQLFQNERRILARLEHPNIARLLDGGADAQGRPYFAMELIEGEPIDEYCDHHRLSLRDRLRLVLELCGALHVAHRNLVVHRDIKPGNILVDGAGAPKLLDFGIAKLTESEGTLATRSGSRPMTLLYASPEQLAGDAVTPASDIYSLGVLTYRLLTGSLPDDLDQLGYLKLVNAVCMKVPERPSERVERLADDDEEQAKELARNRATDPTAWRRQLTGDVDAIVMKALRKEPDSRYGTVERLADDLRRYLDGRPVAAREGNWTYIASKFAQRHRFALSLGTLVLSVFLVLSGLYVMKAQEVKEERDRAETVKDFLLDLLHLAEPYGAESAEDLEAWGRILSQVEEELGARNDFHPEDRLEVTREIAQAWHGQGSPRRAVSLLEESLPQARKVYTKGDDDFEELSKLLADLGATRYALGDLAAAEAHLEEALGIAKARGLSSNLTSRIVSNLAAVHRRRGDISEAEALYRNALGYRQGESVHRVRSLRALAAVLQDQGKLEEAEEHLNEAVDLLDGLSDADRRGEEEASARVSLGRIRLEKGRPREALELFQSVAEIRRQRLGEDHRHAGLIEKDMAVAWIELRETDRARELLERSRELILAGNYGNVVAELAEANSLEGLLAHLEGRDDVAEPLLRNAVEILDEQRPGSRQARLARARLESFLAR